jgi:glucuronokinase
LSGPRIEGRAFARAGVLGNPSDGYFGRALSVIIRDFQATVTLTEAPELRIEPDEDDLGVFRDVAQLAESVSRQGYYGGGRLLKAAIKVFHDFCRERGFPLSKRSFSVEYESTIPRQVGLGGSSAIITGAFRALMTFYEVEIPREELPALILSAELDELGISAGLQDRVVQVYEGLVYMDFAKEFMEGQGYGRYESLDPSSLPRMYLAHRPGPTKVSGKVHDDLRDRWGQDDSLVHETLAEIASLAEEGRRALLAGDKPSFSRLLNENFDLRCRIMNIHPGDLALVVAARGLGASAKLTGSGGAILGVMEDEMMKEQLVEKLGSMGARVLEPGMG